MIKIFRHIRRTLINENRMGKYFKYAIGEILLVVIGILIALQINTWNNQRLNAKKEITLLHEIKENLNEDLQNIDVILSKNALKLTTIDSAFYFLSIKKGKEFSNLMPIITNYDLFTSTSVAFDNMVSSGNIDLLYSDELRKEISRHYSTDILDGVQDQLVVTTQDFLREMAPKMINTEMMKAVTNLDFEVKSATEITIYNDPYVLSHLFVIKNKTIEHNRALDKVINKINPLVTEIEKYINQK